MAVVRQASFATGEVTPLLYGRPDVAKYAAGLKRCRNFFVSRQGQAVSRAGTQYVGQAKELGARVRLIPFVYSQSDAEENFILEFGNLYVRFYKNGVRVDVTPGTALEVATPYLLADLPKLKWVQSGDIITLTHHKYTPKQLCRFSSAVWTLEDFSFSVVPGSTINSTAVTLSPYLGTLDPTTQPVRPWYWLVSVLYQDGRGVTRESAPIERYRIVTGDPHEIAVYPNAPAVLHISSSASPYRILGYRIYRSLWGGRGGYVGFINAPGDFTDSGAEPDYTQPPREGHNPFITTNGVDSFHTSTGNSTVDYPSVVTYFEERLTFGRTDARPAGVFFSATADYDNFDEPLLSNDSTAVDVELAARKREEIRSLVPLNKLMAFTNTSVWAVGGAGNEPLTPTSLAARVQLEVGSNWVDPVVVDGAVLFARSKGTGLRALGYSNDQQGYQGFDICIFAAHLFEGRQVVDMAYQEDPDSLVWVLLDDGTLGCLTFIREQDIWAWSLHTTAGKVESLCCVPEGNEDALYLSVLRNETTGARCIERMKSRRLKLRKQKYFAVGPDDDTNRIVVEQPWCLDSAVVQQAPDMTGLSTVTGLDHLNGNTVWAVGDGVVYGPLTVASGQVTLPAAAQHAIVGLLYQPELETLDPVVPGKETRLVQKVVNRVLVEVSDSNTFRAGPDFSHLVEWKSRLPQDGYGAQGVRSEAVSLNIPGGWGPTGHVCIRQALPLPLTVLGITRDVALGDE